MVTIIGGVRRLAGGDGDAVSRVPVVRPTATAAEVVVVELFVRLSLGPSVLEKRTSPQRNLKGRSSLLCREGLELPVQGLRPRQTAFPETCK